MSVQLTDLPTPFLTVDHSRLRANIGAMQALAASAKVGLTSLRDQRKNGTAAEVISRTLITFVSV